MGDNIFENMAEMRIREAIERGQLKNLPGEGKPLVLEPVNPLEPPEERMFNKIMRTLGLLPEEIELQKEIAELKNRLEACEQGEERDALKKKLSETVIRYNVIMEKRRKR